MRPQRLWKMVLTAALGAALLLPAAAAEAANEANGGETPSYTLTQWGNSFPIQTWGQVVELGAESLTLENSQEDSSYQKLVINVNEDTLILDAVTGQSRTFSDIQQGETLYAWVGPAMTKSLPPITTARLLLCGLPADAAAPTYAEVQSVIQTEEGVDVCVTDQVVLHLSGETELLAAPGSETVSLADIVATVDYTGQDAGPVTVPLTITVNGHPDVGAVGKYSISVTLAPPAETEPSE